MRQIALLLIPARRRRSCSPTPITRLVYQRGAFGAELDGGGLRGAVLVLLQPAVQRRQPAAHAHVLLAPAPVAADRAGAASRCVVNVAVSLALYKPLGIAGVVIGTAVANAAMTLAQAYFLRRELHGFEVARTLRARRRDAGRGRALLGGVAYGVWWLLDDGARALAARPDRLRRPGAGRRASLVYAGAGARAAHPEAQQIVRLIRRRSAAARARSSP